MKSTTIALGLLVASTEVLAYPSMAIEHIAAAAPKKERTVPRLLQEKREKEKRGDSPDFNAAAQYTSTTGEHAFVPPDFDAGDQRGPCPGLNALANHGYIDHSGVDTFNNILTGVNGAYGMALDLAAFLAVFGTVFDGNPISLTPGYSIGGPSDKSENILGNGLGLLGTPQGLSGSHNKYEADSSPTRGDQYLFGNPYLVQVPQAQQYIDVIPAEDTSSVTLYRENIYPFRISRFNNSIETNPYFFFSPFAGVLVTPAGYNFPPAMMANHSAEFPEGYLNKEIMKSFFSLGGSDDAVTYTIGHERIPDNWYKRAIGDEYTIPGFLADVLEYAERDPRLLDVGGNTGTVNSFTPVDIGSLTKGVFPDGTNLLEGNNLECFSLQVVQAAVPDFLGGGISSTVAPVVELGQTIATQLVGAGCPQLQGIDDSVYNAYPGYQKSGSAV
ncbi:Cloroperoxidase [Saccharata proteae CBS 121410]|uniref:Cloroperoxidase n=1 Tax=Saccharata proteae CBS 121410 TaxID=1314787 RepID=A0A9P4HR35_9PEZI|nr:Cloroperoxidase [Saccharata proteae CBS 121410]